MNIIDKSGRGRTPEKLRRSRGRSASSRAWLERQLNDPYSAAAKQKGYRSRAAFKLLELDRKFRFLQKEAKILDLGASPGGWSQVAAQRGAHVVAADLLDMEQIAGVTFFKVDIRDFATHQTFKDALNGAADLVLSDMAAPTTGHRGTDHLRTAALFEVALEIAQDVLRPGGVFVGKLFQGGASSQLLARLKKSFEDVRHVKPPASRAKSVELYVLARGFRGVSK